MATRGATRVKKHLTLSAEVVADLEAEARAAKVTLSEVIEGRLRERSRRGSGEALSLLETRVEQLVMDLADLRAKVLPLVATVTALLRQMEGELPVKGEPEADTTAPRIATYEEMYGEIRPPPVSDSPPPPAGPKPSRKGWLW
jgi:hypothetical protein